MNMCSGEFRHGLSKFWFLFALYVSVFVNMCFGKFGHGLSEFRFFFPLYVSVFVYLLLSCFLTLLALALTRAFSLSCTTPPPPPLAPSCFSLILSLPSPLPSSCSPALSCSLSLAFSFLFRRPWDSMVVSKFLVQHCKCICVRVCVYACVHLLICICLSTGTYIMRACSPHKSPIRTQRVLYTPQKKPMASLLQRRPVKKTIFCKRDLWF